MDLIEIGDHIAADNPAAAERWIAKMIDRLEKASMVPMAGRMVPEFQRDDLREIILRRYRMVYRILKNRIEIVTIFEGHRLFPLNTIEEDDKL